MLMILKGLYYPNQNNTSKLILTNFEYIDSLKQGTLQEDELKTKKHTEMFSAILGHFGGAGLCLVTRFSLKNLTTKGFRDGIDLGAVKDDTAEILQIFDNEIQNEEDVEKKLCFMDFRAEKTLGYTPEDVSQGDRQTIKFIVFGGILGDHPPQDRAKQFREENFKTIRNLGKVQMTTDTALLVSYEIMQQNRNYSDLKFVDDPEVCLEEEVRSFLDTKFTVDQLSQGQPMNLEELIKEAQSFEGVEAKKVEDNPEVMRSMSTIMDGFRYRIAADFSPYPVFNGK